MAGHLVKESGKAELALAEGLGDNGWIQRYQDVVGTFFINVYLKFSV